MNLKYYKQASKQNKQTIKQTHKQTNKQTKNYHSTYTDIEYHLINLELISANTDHHQGDVYGLTGRLILPQLK
jgi:ABC-type transporter Mla subunit MlaD